jgi:hypothetical protein
MITKFVSLLIALSFLVACSSNQVVDQVDQAQPNTSVSAPVILDAFTPAGQISVGEIAVISIDDPMNWKVKNNNPDVVELINATDDGTVQTNFSVKALKDGIANIYAEKEGLGISYTIIVGSEKEMIDVRIGDSPFQISIPKFLGDRVETSLFMDDLAKDLEAKHAVFIYYKVPNEAQPLFASFLWVLPKSKWQEIQNPNEPPLGTLMREFNEDVLIVAGPQDLPFVDRYSNEANYYVTLTTLLSKDATYIYTD